MSEETYAIDLSYETNKMYTTESIHETLTDAFIEFLRKKDLVVFRALAPVVMYEGQSVSMMSRKVVREGAMIDIFENLYEEIIKEEPKAVLVYHFKEEYRWASMMDASYNPVGEPELFLTRILRLGYAL